MSKVKQFFVNLWTQYLKPDINKGETLALAFFSSAIKEIGAILGSEGLQIVTDAVTTAEETGGAPGVKFEAAKNKVEVDLKAAGITAPEHILNIAIEGAVSQMNASAPVVTSEAPTASPALNVVTGLPASSVPVTPSILENTVLQVQAGLNVNAAAGAIVSDMGGQGVTIAYADALAQLEAAVSALPASNSGR